MFGLQSDNEVSHIKLAMGRWEILGMLGILIIVRRERTMHHWCWRQKWFGWEGQALIWFSYKIPSFLQPWLRCIIS
jgi:hypothetical protein